MTTLNLNSITLYSFNKTLDETHFLTPTEIKNDMEDLQLDKDNKAMPIFQVLRYCEPFMDWNKRLPLEGRMKQLSVKSHLYQFLLLMTHPSFVIHYNLGYMQGRSSFLELSECACSDALRDVQNNESVKLQFSFRCSAEYKIIEKINNLFESLKNSEEGLTYFSAGSDQCLSEFMILSFLMLCGFKKVNIHLADLNYKNETSKASECAMRVQTFFKGFPEIQYPITLHASLKAFGEKKIACEVAVAMDWSASENTNSNEKVILYLTAKGFFFNSHPTNSKKTPCWIFERLPVKSQKNSREIAHLAP